MMTLISNTLCDIAKKYINKHHKYKHNYYKSFYKKYKKDKNYIYFLVNKKKHIIKYILHMLKLYSLPNYLVFIPFIESSFYEFAKNKKDYGLWQINTKYFAKNIPTSLLFDYKINTIIALSIFKELFKRYKLENKALCAYNTGRGFKTCFYYKKFNSFVFAFYDSFCKK